MFYLYHPGTEMIDHPHIMRNHHNSNPRLDLFGNKQASLFLKLIISGYKNLIYQQNFSYCFYQLQTFDSAVREDATAIDKI